MQDRIPPHDLDSEEAVIGSCLLDKDAITKISYLHPDHFFRDKNQWIFRAMRELDNRGDAINQVTAAHELQRQDKLESIGGAAYLSNCLLSTPTSAHVEHYAKIVLNLAGNRELIRASEKISDAGYQARPILSESISVAESEIAKIRSDYALDDDRTRKHEDFGNYIDAQRNTSLKPWLVTPWRDFNVQVRMRNGTVATIAGPSSMGKTMCAEQIFEFGCRDLGRNGCYYFLELEQEHFDHRRACRLMTTAEGKAPTFTDLEEGKYADSEEMAKFVCDVLAWPGKATMVSALGWSVHRICSDIRQKAAQGLADFVIVDYIQLIPREDVSRRNVTDARAMGIIMQTLKQTCQSLPNNPPLIVVSQVNRTLKGREDCTIATLRESGEIAEYSNVVTFVYSQWDASKPKGECRRGCQQYRGTEDTENCLRRCLWLVTDKNTFGPKGEVLLKHIPHRYKFIQEG